MREVRQRGNVKVPPPKKDEGSYRTPAGESSSQQAVFSIQQDARVYICGYDVTNWVSNVTAQHSALHVGGNSCSIVLQNPNDIFVVTDLNVKGEFFASGGSSEFVSGVSGEGTRIQNFSVDESIKREIYHKKNDKDFALTKDAQGRSMGTIIKEAMQKMSSTPGEDGEVQTVSPEIWEVYESGSQAGGVQPKKWDLGEGTPIFHTNDPVRVFVRHPYRMVSGENGLESAWYPLFGGYISQTDLMDSLDSGVSVLNISCVGVATKLLQLARVSTNPGIMLDVIGGTPAAETVIADLVNASGFTSAFVSCTFPQFLGLLLAGYDPRLSGTTSSASGAGSLTAEQQKINGVGRFDYGEWEIPWDPKSKSFLSDWTQKTCQRVFTEAQVREHGLKSGFGDAKTVAASKSWGGFNGEHAPDTGKIHLLIPDKDTFDLYNALIDHEQFNLDNPTQTEFESRLDLLKKYAHSYMQYEVWETPYGDIVAEFPMFDFLPDDFGEYGEKQLIHGSSSVSMSFSENESNVNTWVQVQIEMSDFNVPTDEMVKKTQMTAVGILADLIPRFGIRVLNVPAPFIRFTSAAATNALKYFLRVACSKVVAELRSAKTTIGYLDPSLVPNRPYLVAYKNVLGYIVRVSHSLSYQGEAKTDVDLNYIRTIVEDPSTKEKKFLFINASEASKPLNFKTIFGGLPPTPAAEAGGTVQGAKESEEGSKPEEKKPEEKKPEEKKPEEKKTDPLNKADKTVPPQDPQPYKN